MSNGLFEVLAGEDASEQERVAATRAVIAAQTRAKQRFEKYVSKAANQDERDARISLISSDLEEILRDVVEQYGSDTETLRNAATVALGGGHASDCGCGFCENKGNLPGSKKDDDGDSDDKSEKSDDDKGDDSDDKSDDKSDDDKDEKKMPWESATKQVRQTTASAAEFPWEHIAADVETGDSFTTERVDLPSSTDGVGEASPKIDKGTAGDLKPIDVPSNAHPVEQQSVADRADYAAEDFDPSSPTRERVDADKAIQPEHNVADNTDTWTGTEGLASPVTSSVLAKWTVLP